MAEIRIEGKTVGFSSNGVEIDSWLDHLYLVYVDDSGNEFVILGGPVPSLDLVWPISVEEGVPIGESADVRPKTDRDQYGSRVLDLG